MCQGKQQHCYTPWYYFPTGNIFKSDYLITYECEDKSDQIFLSKQSCPNITTYLQYHNDLFCENQTEFNNDSIQALFSQLCSLSPAWIKEHQQDPRYDDPHHCQLSCKEPGPGCNACTNEKYFHCNSSEIHHCIHPDLVCDGHPQCPNNEDEKSKGL